MIVSLRHPVRHLHERQRDALRGVPLSAVPTITDRAHLLQNTGGGILSGCIWQVVQEYKSLVGHRGHHDALLTLRDRTRGDNLAAMRHCGCKACRSDVARLETAR